MVFCSELRISICHAPATLLYLILTVFSEASAQSAVNDDVASLQEAIVEMLLEYVQQASVKQEEKSENILRVIAMLAACFSSKSRIISMCLGDVLDALCNLVLPPPRAAAVAEDGEAAAPADSSRTFKYEMGDDGLSNVEKIVEFASVSEHLARWALGANGSTKRQGQ